MFDALIQTCGPIFLAALVLQALTVFIEQLAAARSPDDEAPRSAWTPLLILLAWLTPALLIFHAASATRNAEQITQITAIAAPVAVTLLAALTGAIMSAVFTSAAPAARKIAPAFAVLTFAAAAFAAWPSVTALVL